MSGFLEILSYIAGPFIAGVIALFLYSLDSPKRKDSLKNNEMERMRILLNEIQEERETIKKERESERKEWRMREEELIKEIKSLRSEIFKLKTEIRELKLK